MVYTNTAINLWFLVSNMAINLWFIRTRLRMENLEATRDFIIRTIYKKGAKDGESGGYTAILSFGQSTKRGLESV